MRLRTQVRYLSQFCRAAGKPRIRAAAERLGRLAEKRPASAGQQGPQPMGRTGALMALLVFCSGRESSLSDWLSTGPASPPSPTTPGHLVTAGAEAAPGRDLPQRGQYISAAQQAPNAEQPFGLSHIRLSIR